MSGPYLISDMFGRGHAHACTDPDCELEHVEMPDGDLHHDGCECEDCALYAYLYLK